MTKTIITMTIAWLLIILSGQAAYYYIAIQQIPENNLFTYVIDGYCESYFKLQGTNNPCDLSPENYDASRTIDMSNFTQIKPGIYGTKNPRTFIQLEQVGFARQYWTRIRLRLYDTENETTRWCTNYYGYPGIIYEARPGCGKTIEMIPFVYCPSNSLHDWVNQGYTNYECSISFRNPFSHNIMLNVAQDNTTILQKWLAPGETYQQRILSYSRNIYYWYYDPEYSLFITNQLPCFTNTSIYGNTWQDYTNKLNTFIDTNRANEIVIQTSPTNFVSLKGLNNGSNQLLIPTYIYYQNQNQNQQKCCNGSSSNITLNITNIITNQNFNISNLVEATNIFEDMVNFLNSKRATNELNLKALAAGSNFVTTTGRKITTLSTNIPTDEPELENWTIPILSYGELNLNLVLPWTSFNGLAGLFRLGFYALIIVGYAWYVSEKTFQAYKLIFLTQKNSASGGTVAGFSWQMIVDQIVFFAFCAVVAGIPIAIDAYTVAYPRDIVEQFLIQSKTMGGTKLWSLVIQWFPLKAAVIYGLGALNFNIGINYYIIPLCFVLKSLL